MRGFPGTPARPPRDGAFRPRLPMLLYAATIFVSAFLLFLVQPVMAKQILPWFGGSAAVWTTCLVFFQTALLAGYAYSDLAVHRLAPRTQIKVAHGAARSCRSRCCRSFRAPHWKPTGAENPSWLILVPARRDDRAAVFPAVDDEPAGAGVVRPCAARREPVSAVRAVESRVDAGARRLSRSCSSRGRRRARRRSAGRPATRSFVALCAAAGWSSLRHRSAPAIPALVATEAGAAAATPLLADERAAHGRATGAVVHARGDRVAAAARRVEPHHAEHRRGAAAVDRAARDLPPHVHPLLRRHGAGIGARPSWRCSRPGSAVMGWTLADPKLTHELAIQIGVFCAGLFLACMFCHGELVRLKPAPKYLTRFYLMISLGGALGSALVGHRRAAGAARVLRARGRARARRGAAALAGAARARRVQRARRRGGPRDRRLHRHGRSASSTRTRSSPRAISTACCACRSSADERRQPPPLADPRHDPARHAVPVAGARAAARRPITRRRRASAACSRRCTRA